jgi:hypothetical protein
MAPSQTVTERKTQLWSNRIKSWKQSGLSQRVYCEQHQLVLGTFVYWRSRLKKQEAGSPADRPRFLPIAIRQQRDASLTLLINGQHHLEIKPDFDPEFLAKVIQAVQKVA